MSGNEPEHVFDEVQIGQGVKPLAQHGFVVVDRGTLALLGSQRQTIASAPMASVSAKKSWINLGQTLAVTIDGEKYNVTLGWGRSRSILKMRKNAATLLELIRRGDGRP